MRPMTSHCSKQMANSHRCQSPRVEQYGSVTRSPQSSSFLLSFLESVPEVTAKLKEPDTGERKFEDVVKSAEQAAVLVLVY